MARCGGAGRKQLQGRCSTLLVHSRSGSSRGTALTGVGAGAGAGAGAGSSAGGSTSPPPAAWRLGYAASMYVPPHETLAVAAPPAAL